MPRSNRPKKSKNSKREEHTEIDLDRALRGMKRTEIKNGVEYTVQSSTGANADEGKTWVCPHCHISIQKGVAHLVAWDAHRDIATRRHFHTACWKSFQGPLL